MHAILYGPDDTATIAERVPPQSLPPGILTRAGREAQSLLTIAYNAGMTIDEAYSLACPWAAQVCRVN